MYQTPYRTSVKIDIPVRTKVRLWWIRVIFRIIRLITLTKRPKKKALPYTEWNNRVFEITHKRGIFYVDTTTKDFILSSANGQYIDHDLKNELLNIVQSEVAKSKMGKKG